ncbi:MAG: hypothetical protein ABJZ55_13990 [Fuerstiella sp.]
MKYRLELPDGSFSRPYEKNELQSLRERSKIPEGTKVLLGTDVDAWLEESLTDDSGPATDKQKNFAESLGVTHRDDITKKQMTSLIDAALDNQAAREEARWKSKDNVKALKRELLDEAIEDGHVRLLEKATLEELIEESREKPNAPDDCGAILIRIDTNEYSDAALWAMDHEDDEPLPTLNSIEVTGCDDIDGDEFWGFIRALTVLMKRPD